MTWNFRSPCPKIVVATNCTHGEQGSQDAIRCTRPVEACSAATHPLMNQLGSYGIDEALVKWATAFYCMGDTGLDSSFFDSCTFLPFP